MAWSGTSVVIVLATFVAMEPVTYLAHRYVMHGFGMAWHRSHHRRWFQGGRQPDESWFERNDLFPVVFSVITMVVIAIAFQAPAFFLLPYTAGATLYGAAYLFVHDVQIHGRAGIRLRSSVLDRLARDHAIHHRFGGEPYGMLFPVVPAELRRRADADNGSTPSQVPSLR